MSLATRNVVRLVRGINVATVGRLSVEEQYVLSCYECRKDHVYTLYCVSMHTYDTRSSAKRQSNKIAF